MKFKTILVLGMLLSSSIMANPIVKTIVNKAVKKVAPKVIPILTTLISSASELGAEEIKSKTMSKKDLLLYKTKF